MLVYSSCSACKSRICECRILKNESPDDDVITTKERLLYSLFNGADYLIKNIVGKYMFFFYTTTFAINPLWLAFWQPALKILDVVTDPLVGEWSDRTRTKMGRRRPWILVGSILLGIVFPLSWMPTVVMFWDPAPTVLSIFIYFMLFKFLYYVTHTIAVVPYYALGAELSNDYHERTKIVGWRHLVGLPMTVVATLPFVFATNPELFDNEIEGVATVMAFVGLIIIVTGVCSALGTRERVEPDPRQPLPLKKALGITLRNRSFMFLVGTVFFYGIGQYFAVSFGAYLITYNIYDGDKAGFATLLMSATAGGVVVSVGLNLLLRHLGKSFEKVFLLKTMMFLSLLAPLAALFAFQPGEPYWYFLFHMFALPIGNTAIELLPLSIVADVCDIDEVESGRRREGAFVGVYNSAFKSGYMFAPALSMVLLSLSGFDGQLSTQSEETKALLQSFFVTGLTVTFACAFLFSRGVKLSLQDVEIAQLKLRQSD